MPITESVSIVIPTLNEAENIPVLVSAILKSGVAFREIVFVDDRSKDGTQEIIRSLAREHPIRLIERPAGEFGLASAIMAGARAAEGDLLLVMDADLSHPPERIGDLLAPLLDGTADMVIGSRYVKGGTTPGWPLWRRTLSRIGAAFAYPLTGARDSMSGFFAISRAHLLELDAPGGRFQARFRNDRAQQAQPPRSRNPDRLPRSCARPIEDVVRRRAEILRALGARNSLACVWFKQSATGSTSIN